VKIQISKTKSVEWIPPWQRSSRGVTDVVGIELGSGNRAGCPAVWLQRRKGAICVACAGYFEPPAGKLPQSWDELRHQAKWSVPSAFRADCAAMAVNSPEAFTRQTTAENLAPDSSNPEGVATSKDGVRSVFHRMADEVSFLQASIPEYQALWLNRLLPEGRRPTAASVQTAPCALLASLSAQPDFCKYSDEMAVFVTRTAITMAGFRRGIPMLYRECPGVAGVAAMKAAVKVNLSLDDAMLDAVFASNGLIDTGPSLEPLLTPVVSQIEQSLNYLRGRLGANIPRLFLMGDPIGCAALRSVIGIRPNLALVSPSPFEGLELPARAAAWKERYCVGDESHAFLTAIGAALAVLEEAK